MRASGESDISIWVWHSEWRQQEPQLAGEKEGAQMEARECVEMNGGR